MKKKITERGYWDGMFEDIKELRRENNRIKFKVYAEVITSWLIVIAVGLLLALIIK